MFRLSQMMKQNRTANPEQDSDAYPLVLGMQCESAHEPSVQAFTLAENEIILR
jgi:hypothetical protein